MDDENKEKEEQQEVEQEEDGSKPLEVLADIARVDTMVTVVDAHNFENYLGSTQSLLEKWGDNEQQKDAIPEEDERNVAHLLIDQIEFANAHPNGETPFGRDE